MLRTAEVRSVIAQFEMINLTVVIVDPVARFLNSHGVIGTYLCSWLFWEGFAYIGSYPCSKLLDSAALQLNPVLEGTQ